TATTSSSSSRPLRSRSCVEKRARASATSASVSPWFELAAAGGEGGATPRLEPRPAGLYWGRAGSGPEGAEPEEDERSEGEEGLSAGAGAGAGAGGGAAAAS